MSRRTGKGLRGNHVDLDVIHVNRGDAAGTAKAMLVFGEHPREVITTESGLHLVRELCRKGSRARRSLDRVAYVIVLNANPEGRQRVDQGLVCYRGNGHGVDLNRNWGNAHRDNEDVDRESEEYNGKSGFSEPETRALRDLVLAERPDLWLSIHSGAYLLGTPWGYTSHRKSKNSEVMVELLRPISEKFCEGRCPVGSLADQIGYESHGCNIDWVSEHGNVPYVSLWEIYVDDTYRDAYKAKAKRQGLHTRAHAARHKTSAVTLAEARAHGVAAGEEAEDWRGGAGKEYECWAAQFNPQTKEQTQAVIDKWTPAYIQLAEGVADRRGTRKVALGAKRRQRASDF